MARPSRIRILSAMKTLPGVVEAPLGPTRLLARAGLGWRLGGARYTGDAFGVADEATALVGLRVGRDLGYWSTVRAGAGPFVAVTYRNLGGELWGLALGGELWGRQLTAPRGGRPLRCVR
jgi:hypothetical protein